jgi:hypothetical protein
MEHINTAIASASEAKPIEFKSAIDAELKSRVYDALLNKKMELATAIFNEVDDEDDNNNDNIEFQSSSEGNVDEDL